MFSGSIQGMSKTAKAEVFFLAAACVTPENYLKFMIVASMHGQMIIKIEMIIKIIISQLHAGLKSCWYCQEYSRQ